MMKLCVSLEKYCKYIGIYQIEPDQSIFNRRNVGVLLIFGQSFTWITAYLLYGATTIREYEECFFLWTSSLATSIGFFVTILRTRTTFQLLDHGNSLIEKRCVDPISKNLYQKAIDQIELLSRMTHILYMKIFFPMGGFPLIIISYYRYYMMNMGKDAFLFFNAMKYPFDERTPIGYAVAGVFIVSTFYVVCYTVSCALSILMTIFLMALALFRDLRNHIETFDESNGDHLKMIEWTKKLYYFHLSIKEISAEFNVLMELLITDIYVYSMISISDTLLMCHSSNNVPDFLIPAMATVVLIVIVFIFCEFGQRMINISARAADDFMRLDWYMLPPSVQNGLPLILAGIQEPISINGLGSIACTREAFKTVCAKVYSYYTALQHF